MDRGLSALAAELVVGNEGMPVFEKEKEIADVMTQNTNLGMNELLTKKDAVYKDLASRCNMDLVKKLKDLITYIELHPQTNTNIFEQVVDLMRQIEEENINQNINEQAKTM